MGYLFIFDGIKKIYECRTLELPWLDNQPGKSCIPENKYKVIKREAHDSVKFNYNHFEILDVPQRTYILIHAANYFYQLQGCIAIGFNFLDINGDGWLDVTHSRLMIRKLNKILPTEFDLQII